MWQGGGEKFRFEGPKDLCARYVRPARVLVERTREMFAINSESGADAATRTYQYDSGAWVRITVFANAPTIITINVTKIDPIDRPQIFEQKGAYGLSYQSKYSAEEVETYPALTTMLGMEHPKGKPLVPATLWKVIPWFAGAAYPDTGNWERWRQLRTGYKLSLSLARQSQACMVQVPTLPAGTVDPWATTRTHVVLGGLYNGTVMGVDEGVDPDGPPNPPGTFSGSQPQQPVAAEQPEESTTSFWIMNHDGVLYAVEHPFPIVEAGRPWLDGYVVTLHIWKLHEGLEFPRTPEARSLAMEAGDYVGQVDFTIGGAGEEELRTRIVTVEIDDLWWDGKKVIIKVVDNDGTDMYFGRTGKMIVAGVELAMDVSVHTITGEMTIVPSTSVLYGEYDYYWSADNPDSLREVYAVEDMLDPYIPSSFWSLLPSEITSATVANPDWELEPNVAQYLNVTKSENIHYWADPFWFTFSSGNQQLRHNYRRSVRPTSYDPQPYLDEGLPLPADPPPHDYMTEVFCGAEYERVIPGVYDARVEFSGFTSTAPPPRGDPTGPLAQEAAYTFSVTTQTKGYRSYCVLLIIGAYYDEDGVPDLVRMVVDSTSAAEVYRTPSASGHLAQKQTYVTTTQTATCDGEQAQRTVSVRTGNEYSFSASLSYSQTSIDYASSGGAVFCKKGMFHYVETCDPLTDVRSNTHSWSGTSNFISNERRVSSHVIDTSTLHIIDLRDFFPEPYSILYSDHVSSSTRSITLGFFRNRVSTALSDGTTIIMSAQGSFRPWLVSVDHWGWVGDHIQSWWPSGDENVLPYGWDSAAEARVHFSAGSAALMVESSIGNWSTSMSTRYNSAVITKWGKFGEPHETSPYMLDAYANSATRGDGLAFSGENRPLWKQKNNCAINPLTRQVALYFPGAVSFAGIWPDTWRHGPYNADFEGSDPLNVEVVTGNDGLPVYLLDYRNFEIGTAEDEE